MEARRYLVRGRVQGVGFRAFTRATATALGLTGEVRNLPDGRVEAHAQGEPEALRRLEEQLARGPAVSLVESVDGEAVELRADRTEFRITF